MKKSFLLLLAIMVISPVFSQISDFETWAKQKHEQYDKWKKMRAEIVSHLPGNPEADRISSFIDQGFGSSTSGNAIMGSYPSQQSHQPVNPNVKIWAVIVGVAAYEYISPLTYTKDDAYRMYAFYKSPEGGSLPDRQITLLIDEEATRKNIMKAFQDTYSQAGKDDIIIFYFSGHGAEGAFITGEFNRKDYLEDGKGLLWHEELQAIFEQSPAKCKYLIADACHAGTLTESASDRKGTRSRSSAFYQAFEQAKGGFVLLLSCMGDEVSIETSGIRQGVFSHYLLRGLKGEGDSNKDRIVSVTELFDYVNVNVKNFTDGEQNPVISGNYNETLPIAIVIEN